MRVLVIGGTTLDFIINKEPIREAKKIELNDDDFFLNIGGGGSNASYILNFLGIDVYFLTKLGNDWISNILEDFLKKEKIKLIKTKKEGKSAVSFIFEFGDRVIYTYRGTLNNLKKEDILESIPEYDWLYITSNKGKTIKLIKELFDLSKKKRKKIFINPSLYSINDLYYELNNCDLLVLNKEEAKKLTKKRNIKNMLKKLNKNKIAVITDGKNGVYFKKEDKFFHLNVEELLNLLKGKVIDTTGAGDCFSATFFYFFVKEKLNIVDSVILASINAIYLIQRIGTKHSLTKKNLLKYLEIIKKNNLYGKLIYEI